jgi:hypothetical protein
MNIPILPAATVPVEPLTFISSPEIPDAPELVGPVIPDAPELVGPELPLATATGAAIPQR